MEFAKKKGASVVMASSSSIYNGHPPPQREDMVPFIADFYTEARLSAERLALLYGKMFGVKSTCLRFFSVYGPNEASKGRYANLVSQFIWDLQAGRRPVVYGDGTQTRDFVYVKDVIDACLKAAESQPTGVFNVGTGRSYTVNEMLGKVMNVIGVQLEPRHVPIPMSNYVMHTQADTRKAKSELGFEAKFSLDDGLKLMVPPRLKARAETHNRRA
jgi:UDP-glucose 4-epimerase